MRKYSSLALAATAAFALVLFSCTKEEKDALNEDVTTPEEVATPAKYVSVTVSFPEDGFSKVSFTPDVDGYSKPILKLAWEDGDVITVNGNSFTIDPASITNNGKTAKFTGAAPDSAPYTIVYGSLPGTPNEQTQAADGNTGHLGYYASLAGVDDYQSIQFNSTWAAAHGGAFSQSGVLLVKAKLPSAAIADAVKKVIIRTSDNVLNGSNSLAVTLTTTGVAGDGQVLSVYAVLSEASTLTADTELLFDFQVDASKAYKKYTAYRKLAAAKNLELGKLNNFTINAEHIDQYAGPSDAGTDAAPYLIADQNQMNYVRNLLTTGSAKCFKMVDDIYMTGIAWVPIVISDNDTRISFDGDNHTLYNINTTSHRSYNSIFGNLTGTVQNLVIDNAHITEGSNIAGVLASHLGMSKSKVKSVVSNVTFQNNSRIGNSQYKGSGRHGIIAGKVENPNGAEISDISITGGSVASTGYAGGLVADIGYATTISGTNTISGLKVYGSVVGGAIGYVAAKTEMSGCTFTEGTVTASAQNNGGMIGWATAVSGTVITDCHVENSTIDATAITGEVRTGGFIGYHMANVQIKGCTVGTESQRVTVKLGKPSDTGKRYLSGGFAGLCYGDITKNGDVRCKAYVTITSDSDNNDNKLCLGGFVGFHQTGTIEYCDADVVMSGLKGTYIGGFCGESVNSTIQYCTVTGTVTGYNYCGGFLGVGDAGSIEHCSASGSITAHNMVGGFTGGGYDDSNNPATCSYSYNSTSMTVSAAQYVGGFVGIACGSFNSNYATGNVTGSAAYTGGFCGVALGYGTPSFTNCYASGNVSGDNGAGGFIAKINAAGTTVSHCAAWNSTISAAKRAAGNWSTASVVAIAYPTCILTDNYRKPGMSVTAYWVPSEMSTFQHANVSSSSPLTDSTGTPMADTSNASGQTHYPQYPYFGKIETGKTLSQLASTTLGWSGDVWDFSGDMPTLR